MKGGTHQRDPQREQTAQTTPSVPKSMSYICLDTDVSRHVLVLDTSVSRQIEEKLFGTEVIDIKHAEVSQFN